MWIIKVAAISVYVGAALHFPEAWACDQSSSTISESQSNVIVGNAKSDEEALKRARQMRNTDREEQVFIAGDFDKKRFVSVSALLDPASGLYGKELSVYGYFKMLGIEGSIQYGRICLDRESLERNYRPYCLIVEMNANSFAKAAKAADGDFARIEATAEVEDLTTSHPGKLVKVTILESYE